MATYLVAGLATEDTRWWTVCAALALAWVVASAWNAEGGTLRTALRGLLGGLAAFGLAIIGYGVLQLAGIDLRWEWLTSGAGPALAAAAAIGLVEEGAKLGGVALAAPRGRRGVLRITAAVAAVFAVAEAALVLRGASWPVALGRAAFGPVAHGVLAAPFALSLAGAAGVPRPRLALRLALTVAVAAALHGLGDWSLAHPGWGRFGFAAALLAPTFWLYACARARRSPAPPLRAAPAPRPPRPVAQMGGRLLSP